MKKIEWKKLINKLVWINSMFEKKKQNSNSSSSGPPILKIFLSGRGHLNTGYLFISVVNLQIKYSEFK